MGWKRNREYVAPMREHRTGRHEGARGLKPPVTAAHHDEALSLEKRGRYEQNPPVFLSSFSGESDAYVIPATGGWFATSKAHGDGGLAIDDPGM